MDRVTGAELIVSTLASLKVEKAFNVIGTSVFPLVSALLRHRDEVQYVTATNESALTLMADGYGRAARKASFVNLYHSSGTSFGMVGLSTAWADHTPMIFTTTTSSRQLSRSDQYAAVPNAITEATSQYTKWHWEVPLTGRIPEAIARAFVIATTPPMGPVHLAFPQDLYIEEVEFDLSSLPTPDTLRVYSRFAADDRGLDDAAEILRTSDRTLILAGGDVGQYRARSELVELSEALSAAVMVEGKPTYLGFPNGHELFVGAVASTNASVRELERRLWREADVILSVGYEFTERASSSGESTFSPDQKVIQLTTDSREIGKQVSPHIALIGHPKATLAALLNLVKSGLREDPTGKRAWVRAARDETRVALEHGLSEQRARRAPGQALLDVFTSTVFSVFEQPTIVDHSQFKLSPYIEFQPLGGEDDYFALSQKASAQGWGVPAAIGMQMAYPDRQVVAVVGDGGFMFTSQAIYTAARLKIPVIVAVINNGGWGSGGYNETVGDPDHEVFVGDFREPPINISQLASALGVFAKRIDDPDEIADVLKSSREHDGPTLLELMCQ